MTGSHRDEIAKLEALYSANPEGRIFTHLAEAYRKAGDLARARETVERGLERHGDYSSAHVVRGRILIDQGETWEAERAFQRVLELDPENRIALWTLGDLAREAGRPAEALGFYQELLLLDPTDEAAEALARSLDYELSAARAAAEPGTPAAEVSGAAAVDSPLLDEPFEFMPLAEEPPALEPIDLAFGALGMDSFDPFDLGSATLELESAALEASPEPREPEPFDVGPELIDLDALTDEAAAALIDLDEVHFGLEQGGAEPVELEAAEVEADALEAIEPDSAELEPAELEPIELDDEESPAAALSAGDLYGFEEFSSEFGDFASEGSELPWGGDELSVGWGDENETAPVQEEEAPVVDAEFDAAALAGAEPEGSAELSGEGEVAGAEEVLAAEHALEVTAGIDAHEAGPVVTETLAELYASQGLYDQAADIYRELLRIRPGDPRLAFRLEALERAAQSAADASSPVPEPIVIARSGRSIAQYLSGLLAFVGPVRASGDPEVDAPAVESSTSEAAVEMLPDLDALPELETSPVDELPAFEPAPAEAPLVAEMALASEIPATEVDEVESLSAVVESAADDFFYLDESMVVEEGSAESDILYLDESMVVAEAAGGAGDEFDRLFAGQGEPEVEAPASPPVAAAGVGEGDDDDLEMFRSWLQNLKRS